MQPEPLPFETEQKPGVCRYCWNGPIVDEEDDACEVCRGTVAELAAEFEGVAA